MIVAMSWEFSLKNSAYIGQRSGRAIYSQMADFSAELTRTIPIYELEFNLDGESLWQVVTELEEMTKKKE